MTEQSKKHPSLESHTLMTPLDPATTDDVTGMSSIPEVTTSIASLEKQQDERKQRIAEINEKLAELLKVDDELDALEREALELLIKRLRK